MHFFLIFYNIVIALIYAINTYCFGYVAARPLVKHVENALWRFILRIALGYNIIIFCVHLLGLVSFLNDLVYAALSFSGIILVLVLRRKFLRDDLLNARKRSSEIAAKAKMIFTENKLAIFLLFIFIASLVIVSFAPVTKSDELNYFFTFVKRIVTQGALNFDYYQVLSFQPMVQPLWYVPAYGLGAHESPGILNLIYSFLLIFVSYTWARKFVTPAMAVLAVLATYININGLMIYPAPQDVVAVWLWTLIALIVTYEFVYPKEVCTPSHSHFFCIGLIFATACLVKLSALPVVFCCLILVFIKGWQNKYPVSKLLIIFIPFVIFYVPFLIKAYLWTGNPLFPALTWLFGSPNFDINALNVYFSRPATHWQPGFLGVIKTLTENFIHNLKWNLSPIFIFVAPIALFFLLKAKRYLFSAMFVFLFVYFTIATASARLHGGILIFLVLIVFILAKNFINNKYIIFLIKLHATLLTIVVVVYTLQFAVYVFGFQSQPDFMRDKVRVYDEIMWVNKNLPENSRVVMTTNEMYYLDFPAYCLDEYPLLLGKDMRKYSTPEEIYNFLKTKQITHLFLAENYYDFDVEFRKKLRLTGEQYGKLIYEKDNVTVRGYRHPLKKPLKGNLKIYSLN